VDAMMRHKTAMASAINLHNSQKATFLKAVELGLGQYSHIPDPGDPLSIALDHSSHQEDQLRKWPIQFQDLPLQKPLGFSMIFP